MESGSRKSNMVWGSLLILIGIVAFIETFTEIGVWIWFSLLVVAGLISLGAYFMNRSEVLLLLPTYVTWAIAGLLLIVELEILQGDGIAGYVLTAVALPFLVVYFRNREQWWALIPAYILLVVGLMVVLLDDVLQGTMVPAFVLSAIALPFIVIFARDRKNWWALIPAYVLLAVGLMVVLLEDVLGGNLVPAYVMFAIALPFFAVYLRNRENWWALIPAGIMSVIGISFLIAEAAVEYVFPVALILVGVWILTRQFMSKDKEKQEIEPGESKIKKA